MRWFSQQPYTQPEHLLVDHIHLPETLWQFIHSLLDIPFLLLPIAALFLLSLRGIRPCFLAIAAALQLGYLFLSIYPSHLRGHFPLEPALGDWVNVYGVFPAVFIHGTPTIFLSSSIRVLFTIVSLGGLLSLITLLLSPHPAPPSADGRTRVSWHPLIVLTAPFAVANLLLLIPRAAGAGITERYLLILLLIALPCLLRFCQDRVQPQFPALCILLVAVMAIFAITLTHNLFSLYRARVALVRELSAAGVPPTSVDNGWEYNVSVELQYAPYINNFRMAPPHAYVTTPPLPAGTCPMSDFDEFPHIRHVTGSPSPPMRAMAPLPSLRSTTPAGLPLLPAPFTSCATSLLLDNEPSAICCLARTFPARKLLPISCAARQNLPTDSLHLLRRVCSSALFCVLVILFVNFRLPLPAMELSITARGAHTRRTG